MRWKVGILVGSLAPLAGCSTFELAGRNLVNEPIQYADEKKVERRLRHDAQRLWRTIACQYPQRTFSEEFRDGFLDGYTDYLDSGGRPTPPLVPPVEYRRSKYLCPSGHALIRDYFAGFKYGVEVACASGQRQYLTVPVLLPVGQPEAPLRISTGDGPAPVMPPPPPLPSEEAAKSGTPLAVPLGPPQPVPASPQVVPAQPVPPRPAPAPGFDPPNPPPVNPLDPSGASLPRLDVPRISPPAPSGPSVPAMGKVRPAAATEHEPPGNAADSPLPGLPTVPAPSAPDFSNTPRDLPPAPVPTVAEPPPPAAAVPDPPAR